MNFSSSCNTTASVNYDSVGWLPFRFFLWLYDDFCCSEQFTGSICIIDLQKHCPMVIDISDTDLGHRFPTHFSSVNSPTPQGTVVVLQFWDSLQDFTFPVFVQIRQVLDRLRMLSGMEMTLIACFLLQTEGMFPKFFWTDPPVILSHRRDLLS